MAIEHCTAAAGCSAEQGAVTLDANWRWIHDHSGYENCFTDGNWSEHFCPDAQTCASRCALEGVDTEGYSKTYGIDAIPGGVELKFTTEGGNVGSRIYLTDGDESYKVFKLKNREFTVDVDVASLACGLNGALYFVEMDAAGGKGVGNNEAGAKFGTGYCDAQCPNDVKWMDGEANVDGQHGMCCFEMDIWEANRMATAFTPHPCSVNGAYRCTGTECGDGAKGERYMGVCDKDGCDFNAFRMGDQRYYGAGPGFAVDTTKPMTVVTQFLTTDGTDQGDLAEIRRFYVQDGRVITHTNSTIPGVQGNSITDEFCSAQKMAFQDFDHHRVHGGLKKMGEALDRGLVLALSLWDDGATEMRWLDSCFPAEEEPGSRLGVTRGPCDGSTSNPKHLRTHEASATVKYTNIRYGEIGSTTPSGGRRLGDAVFV
jgi:cellulose 1,4-beta-cellobiosidase